MNTVISEGINLTPEDHLYILGDMIDRGQDGIRILQDVSSRPNVTCLLGNHEYMMWNYVSRHIFKDLNWLNPSNGGMQTLSEYRKLMPADRASVKKYLAELFLQIELTVEGTTFLLSHSSFLSGYGTVKWRDKSITAADVSNVVWYSPWRSFEHTEPQRYRRGNIRNTRGIVLIIDTISLGMCLS